MNDIFIRCEKIFGEENMQKLKNSAVAVFGIGGVGGYVVEGLARSGVGTLHLIDNDSVKESNLNRQIFALQSTIGQDKVDIAEKRIKDINPNCNVIKHKIFFLPENKNEINFNSFDYIIDAIDTVTAKIAIIECANSANKPIISCMGTGNKTNPAMLEIDDIYKTSVCPLARVLRKELKKRNIKSLKVVYSKEEPVNGAICCDENDNNGRHPPASCVFVPAVAGMIIASEVVRDLIKN